jgi:hypothetical protein
MFVEMKPASSKTRSIPTSSQACLLAPDDIGISLLFITRYFGQAQATPMELMDSLFHEPHLP